MTNETHGLGFPSGFAPNGHECGLIFIPWIFPNLTHVFLGTCFKSHPWVTYRMLEIS
jgi:hypothetical protein